MLDDHFVPKKAPGNDLSIPYFYEATYEKHGIIGHNTGKSIAKLQSEIIKALGRLGGGGVLFQEGEYSSKPLRPAWKITFTYDDRGAAVYLKCLPIKTDTKAARQKTLVQALYTFHKSIEMQWGMKLLSPGYSPLAMYVILPTGQTVYQALAAKGYIPQLAAEIIEGEYKEIKGKK